MVGIAVLALPCAYIGAYHHLSRTSLRDNADYGMDGILYVPMREVFPPDGNARSPIRRRAIRRQVALATFFAPVNWLDQIIFGAPPAASCFLMRSG